MMLDADCAEIGRDKEVESLGCEKFDGCDKNGQIEMRPGAPGVIQNEVTGNTPTRSFNTYITLLLV